MPSKQIWTINGQSYNRSQLAEIRRQGFDPRVDEIILKGVTNVKETEESADNAVEDVKEELPEVPVEEAVKEAVETELEEFERLKTERAWVNPEKKGRYNELKAKFTNP